MRLEILSGPLRGQTVEVQATLSVGREPGNGVVLPDRKVSRVHATLNLRKGRLVVVDGESRNGTWVNDRRVERERMLRDGDRLRIGGTEMRVVVDAPEAQAEHPGDGPTPDHIAAADVAAPEAGAPAERQEPEREPQPEPERTPAPVPEPPRRPTGRASRRSLIQRSKGTTTLLRMLEGRMRRLTIVAALAFLVALAVVAMAVAGVFGKDEPTVADVVKQASPSVWQVAGDVGTGTGWIYRRENGLLVTNFHVIDDNPKLSAVKGSTTVPLRVVAAAPCEDLAVLQPTGDGTLAGPALPLAAHQSDLEQGQAVAAIGYPSTQLSGGKADHLVAASGVVSAVRLSLPAHVLGHTYPNVIQTDATTNHGQSGGPLLDLDGEVVGVTTLGSSPYLDPETGEIDATDNEYYAIGVDRVRHVLGRLADGRSLGFMGAFLYYPTREEMEKAGGAYVEVSSVVPGSWADQQRLGRNHEWIVGLNGEALTRADASEDGWCRNVGGLSRGQTAKLDTIVGSGAGRTVTLTARF